MEFNLKIFTDNAAFEADPLELQRVIKNAANRVAQVPEGETAEGRCMDANGNTVGAWTLTDLGED
jgi:hypothetical protein